MSKSNIEIRDGDGRLIELPVEADLVGRWFAVHRTFQMNDRFSKRFWTVTHVPSGLACCTYVRTKREAVKKARQLEAVPVDWENVRKREDSRLKGYERELRVLVAQV